MSDDDIARHHQHVGWSAILATLEAELRHSQRRIVQLHTLIGDLRRDLPSGDAA